MAIETPREEQADTISWCRVVEAAARDAVRNSIRRHRLLGEDVVIWRDGAVTVVPAGEIPSEWTDLET